MEPHGVIDAQFNRAVEIVQNLPTTGPIQTGYEDKLDMYRCVVIRPQGCIHAAHVTLIAACSSKVTSASQILIRHSLILTPYEATMGNVQGSRPSMWEILPRAKW